jgi:hypothetical protein
MLEHKGFLLAERGEIVLESSEGGWIEKRGAAAVADVQCRRAYSVVVVDFLFFFHSWPIMKDLVPVPRLSIRPPGFLSWEILRGSRSRHPP